jgi:hypothetical protein
LAQQGLVDGASPAEAVGQGLREPPRFTQGFHSLLLPEDPARALYLVEREWWAPLTERLLAEPYALARQPAPAGLERFDAFRLTPRPGVAPWTSLPDVGWALGPRLVGYALPAEARPGQAVGLVLRWRVVAPAPDEPGQDYTFATALVDAAGREVANRDWLGHPMPAWRAGDELVSWFEYCLPATLPPSALRATVALYSRADFVRPPLRDATGAVVGDRLTFGALAVDGAPVQPTCSDRLHPAVLQ